MQIVIEVPDVVADFILTETVRSVAIHQGIAETERYPIEKRSEAAIRVEFLHKVIKGIREAKEVQRS